ncbi:MAG: TlpA family protein disulfide reductase [Flavobacteriaceae bacterium]
MIRNILFILLILFVISSCSEEQKDIQVALTSETGYSNFLPGKAIIMPSRDSIEHKGVPTTIKEYVVRSYSLQRFQSLFYKYKKANKSFAKIAKRYKIDTTKLSTRYVDTEILILVGTINEGQRIIIVDTDNDEDFRNEKILTYDFPLPVENQKEILEKLPTVEASFEYYHGQKIESRKVLLKPSPYKGSMGMSFSMSKNKLEKKYSLFISIPEFKKGNIEVDGIKYNLAIANGFTGVEYSDKKTKLYMAKNEEKFPLESKNYIPYKTKDIINFNGKDFEFRKISTFGDSLFLSYKGVNNKPIGINEGLYIPSLKGRRLDSTLLNIDSYKDKLILLDFWGTWCQPCIEALPDLKTLHREIGKNERFKMISISYDRNLEKVKKFTKENEMNWDQLFVNSKNRGKNSMIEKLRITEYPSTLLIDASGKIIARNKSIKELKEIIKKRLEL